MDPTPTPSPDPPETPSPPASPPGRPPGPQAPLAPPPATEIVLKGAKREGDVALERTLKERETRIAELEDENRTLKTPPTPTPPPTPAKKKSWLKGWTLFPDDD
jgi:hypothetical protein